MKHRKYNTGNKTFGFDIKKYHEVRSWQKLKDCGTSRLEFHLHVAWWLRLELI